MRMFSELAAVLLLSSCVPTQAAYELMASGSSACLAGTSEVDTVEDCQAAAVALGLTWKKTENNAAWAPNCYKGGIADTAGVYFNTHATGLYDSSAQTICGSQATCEHDGKTMPSEPYTLTGQPTVGTQADCIQRCRADSSCKAFSWPSTAAATTQQDCYFKNEWDATAANTVEDWMTVQVKGCSTGSGGESEPALWVFESYSDANCEKKSGSSYTLTEVTDTTVPYCYKASDKMSFQAVCEAGGRTFKINYFESADCGTASGAEGSTVLWRGSSVDGNAFFNGGCGPTSSATLGDTLYGKFDKVVPQIGYPSCVEVKAEFDQTRTIIIVVVCGFLGVLLPVGLVFCLRSHHPDSLPECLRPEDAMKHDPLESKGPHGHGPQGPPHLGKQWQPKISGQYAASQPPMQLQQFLGQPVAPMGHAGSYQQPTPAPTPYGQHYSAPPGGQYVPHQQQYQGQLITPGKHKGRE